MTAPGWHPDPAGGPGRLRWWDGQAWTDHVHDQVATAVTPAAAPVGGSPLDAAVLVVGPPRSATPGTRVFELADGEGRRLGRLVETTRGVNDSRLGAALSRSTGWQHATTREVRGPRGYPELVLAWGPPGPEASPGLIVVSLPDRREVGRYVREAGGWAVVAFDGQRRATAAASGVAGPDGRPLSTVAPDGAGGWRAAFEAAARQEPLRALVVGAAAAADLL
ncbi:MAG: DUF2510 domain-containing protein [Acidimicrobiales bacterium]